MNFHLMKASLQKFFHTLNQGFNNPSSQRDLRLKLKKPSLELRILYILQKEGFIENWALLNSDNFTRKSHVNPSVNVKFKFKNKGAPNVCVKHFPRRKYLGVKELYAYNHRRGFNCLLLTTPRGILTHRESIFYGIGGVALCELQVN